MKNISALKKLEKTYESCEKCPLLVENRTHVVFGSGDVEQCRVMIIGEAPGKNEDLEKIPFIGRSGKLLDSLLEEIGLDRTKDVYITNTVLCRPPNNRNPSKKELENCKERLKQHITYINPEIVITLGNFATQYMLETKEGITTLKGNIYEKEFKGKTIKVLPSLHPAVLVYNGNSPKKRTEFIKDLSVIRKVLKDLPENKKQQTDISEFYN